MIKPEARLLAAACAACILAPRPPNKPVPPSATGAGEAAAAAGSRLRPGVLVARGVVARGVPPPAGVEARRPPRSPPERADCSASERACSLYLG